MMLSARQSQRRKAVLLAVIAVTSAVPLFFIRLNEPSVALALFKLLAKIGSLCGMVLMFWQFVLGCRQAAARWVTPDYLWVIRMHRRIGIGAVCLIALHPVFIVPYYQLHPDYPSLFEAWPASLVLFVPLGILAFVLLLAIALSSTALRSRLSRRVWYGLHMTSYAVFPLALIHGLPIGMTLRETALGQLWVGLCVLTGFFFVYRALCRFGLLDARYEVVQVAPEGTDTVDIAMRPLRRPIDPGSAQFAFFRRRLLEPARPFTVSKYDAESGALSITVKAMGRISSKLQTVQPGRRIWVDGPYGVFGREAFETDRPIVMLAGGIGVTPFRRMIDELDALPDREAYLFYGNPKEQDIAHREEIEDAGHVDVVHVLSGTPQHEEMETGRITIDLIRSYLDERLVDCEYFLCGPPPMVKTLEADLLECGVPGKQIHHELFSY